MTTQKIEVFRAFGGGWELWVGDECMGVFESREEALAFSRGEL